MFTQLTAAVSGLSSDGVDIRGEIVQSSLMFQTRRPSDRTRQIESLIGVNRVLFEVISVRRKIIL